MKSIVFSCLLCLSFLNLLAQPEPCGPEGAMTSTCLSACVICDIDGFTGTNNLTAQGQGFPNFCTTQFHNMSYIAFVAGSVNLTINVTVTNCDSFLGLEIGFFESSDCETFDALTFCDTDVAPNTTVSFSNDVPLVIGQHYYLVMDGSNGTICDWTFDVIAGTTELSPLTLSGDVSGALVTCATFPTPYFSSDVEGATIYDWTVNGVIQDDHTQNPDITFPTPGTYELCVTASNPCDSATPTCIEVQVVPSPTPTPTSLEQELCIGDSIEVAGQMIGTTGFYTFDITVPPYGCDSTVTLDLLVYDPQPFTIDEVICIGDSVVSGGQTFMTTGEYDLVTQTPFGCDSMIHVSLLVLDPQPLTIIDTLCIGECLLAGGESICETGDYELHVDTPEGCDSTIFVSLYIIKPDTLYLSERICEDECFDILGESFCQTGTYELLTATADGCDSTIFVNVLQLFPEPQTIITTLCDGDCLDVAGEELCTTGIYDLVAITADGCDSLIHVELDFFPQASSFVDINMCNGEEFLIGTTPYTTTGVFIDTILNDAFCDSIVTLDLFIIECEITGVTEMIEPICFGEANGFLIFSVDNGTPPFNYEWSHVTEPTIGGTGSTNLFINNMIEGVPEGFYEVYISDNFGNDVVFFQEVTQPTPISVSLSAVDLNGFNLSCNGGADGTTSAIAMGGYPPYNFTWSNQDFGEEITNLSAGSYHVSVTDSRGCVKVSDDIVLTEPSPIVPFVSFIDPNCDGFDTGAIRLDSVIGGTPFYTYAIENDTFSNDILYRELSPGSYDFHVLDANGCIETVTGFLNTPDIPVIDLGDDKNIFLGDSIELTMATNGSNIVDYEWTHDGTLRCDSCRETFVYPFFNTTYSVQVISADSCITRDTIDVKLQKIRDVYVPNVFSPNGDGINDNLFIGTGKAIKSILSFSIVNRWGALVYECNDCPTNVHSAGWNGDFKGQAANTGVYIWVMEVSYLDDVVLKFTGDVAIMR